MRILRAERDDCLVLKLAGRLDAHTAPGIHRRLLELLATEQRPLVCDLSGVEVANPLALALFRGVGVQASHWPGTPVLLCRADPPTADSLHRLGVDKVVPLRASLAAAVRGGRGRSPVLGDVLWLPPLPPATRAAREYVRSGCRGYSPETVETAAFLANELVAHALKQARSELAVLLSLRGPAIRLAVADDDPQLPHAAPRPLDPRQNLDLRMLTALTGTWGALPTGSGKVVWCLLED